jgi:capsular exopolysaccharide synthesis family protein
MSTFSKTSDAERPRLSAVETRAGFQRGWEDSEQDGLRLIEYWHIFKRYRWSIFAMALLGGAIGVLAAMKSVPMYRAETQILVKYNQPNLYNVQQFEGTPLYWYFYETQIDIIKSRAIAEKVAEKIDVTKMPALNRPDVPKELNETPGKLGQWVSELKSWLNSWKQMLPAEWGSEPKARTTSVSQSEAAVGGILGGLSVSGGKESEVLRISYESTDPEWTATVANAVADAYIEFGLESRIDTVGQATSWLGKRINDLRVEVENSEKALQQFQTAEGLVSTENREKVIGAKLGSLTGELIKAQAMRSQAEARYRQIKVSLGNEAEHESIVAVVRNPLVLEAHRLNIQMERRVSELNERYGEKHPKMRAARTDLTQAKQHLRLEISKAVETARKEFEVAKAQEQSLKKIINAQQAEMRTLTGKAFTLAKLEREVEANHQLYETFVTRFKETNIANDVDVTNVRIIDRAKVPMAPFKPDKKRIITLSIFVAFLLGVVIATVRARLDDTVKTREDVENRLGLPLFGMLQQLKVKRRSGKRLEQYVLTDPRTPFSEAVNDIRTSILYSDVDNPPKVILITSPVADEGKTILATNLALAFCKRGKCLLLEADLRKGRLSTIFGQEANHHGLSDAVLGDCDLQSAISIHPEANDLHFLSAGMSAPNPLEVVSSRKFSRTIEQLRKSYDYVIMDGAPLLPVSDSIVLGHLSDAVIFTVKAQATSLKIAEEALKRLLAARVRPTGVVLQQVDFEALANYSYGYREMYRSYSTYQYERSA